MYTEFFELFREHVVQKTRGIDVDLQRNDRRSWCEGIEYRLFPEREQYQPDKIRLGVLPLCAEGASEELATHLFGERTRSLVLVAFEDGNGEKCFNLFSEGTEDDDHPHEIMLHKNNNGDAQRLKEFLLEWAGDLTDEHADERLEILQTHTFEGLLPPY